MFAPTMRFAWLLTMFTSVLACGTKQPEEAPKTDAKAKIEPKPEAKTETKPETKPEAKAEPRPDAEPESNEPPPNRDGVALTIRLKPAPAESLAGFEFSALPAPQASTAGAARIRAPYRRRAGGPSSAPILAAAGPRRSARARPPTRSATPNIKRIVATTGTSPTSRRAATSSSMRP